MSVQEEQHSSQPRESRHERRLKGKKGFTEVEVTEEAKSGIQLQLLVRRKDLA
jgi:hypothetical protein